MLTTYVLETRQKDFYCSFIVVLKSKSAETGSSLGLSCWPCHLNVSISGLCEVAFVIITSLPLVQPSKHAWFVSPYTFLRVFKIYKYEQIILLVFVEQYVLTRTLHNWKNKLASALWGTNYAIAALLGNHLKNIFGISGTATAGSISAWPNYWSRPKICGLHS